MTSPQGEPIPGAKPGPGLESVLIEKGLATPDQIQTALQKAKAEKLTLSSALVALGYVTDDQIRRLLAPKKPASDRPRSIDPSLVNMIKGYRIDKRLGSGGMGDVYLAQQTSLDRPVALKILPMQLAKDVEFVQRFISEARAAGKVAHENIVAAVDVGESNGRYYFVMELVEGPTLQQRIEKEGPLPEKAALEIAKQVARGLRHAHAQGLIHRDIKPANIMFSAQGVAKICDFGLARRIDEDVTLTMPGVVQSSPAYASPEQCRGRRDLDHRTDMYSLGVTLFEMLTGKRPFTADNPGALFIKHATEAPPAPQSLNPAISANANALVLRLLRKEPKQRFESYDELIEAIENLPRSKPAPKAKALPHATRRYAAAKRLPVGAAMAAVFLLAAGGGLFWFLRKPPEKPVEPRKVEKTAEKPRPSAEEVEARAKAKLEEKADAEATRILGEAEALWGANRSSEALALVRSFGWDGTPAAVRVADKRAEWERALEERAKAEQSKVVAAKPAEPEKKPLPEPVSPKPEPQTSIAPPKEPVPVVPSDHVRVLRTAGRRADLRERDRAATAFRALAAQSALYRAAQTYLSRDDKFWKLSPAAAKSFDEYLAALPIERADSMSTADHQGQFVRLAKRISDLGETPRDPLILFALGHCEELLGQNVRPDAEGLRLCKFQSAKTADFWGPAATVNRLALARLLAGQGSGTDLQRTEDLVAATPDFPSRFLCALSNLHDKDLDPTATAAAWKRVAAFAPETPAGKFCDQVSERFKKASVCDGCTGQGKYPCKKCSATGIAECDKCKGSGRVKESETSTFSYTVPCPQCKQKGKYICPTCQGGKVAKCDKCDGRKVRKTVPGAEFQDILQASPCSSCGGTGGVFARVAFPCPDCDGTGRFPSR